MKSLLQQTNRRTVGHMIVSTSYIVDMEIGCVVRKLTKVHIFLSPFVLPFVCTKIETVSLN
jgi:hypothetical protein